MWLIRLLLDKSKAAQRQARQESGSEKLRRAMAVGVFLTPTCHEKDRVRSLFVWKQDVKIQTAGGPRDGRGGAVWAAMMAAATGCSECARGLAWSNVVEPDCKGTTTGAHSGQSMLAVNFASAPSSPEATIFMPPALEHTIWVSVGFKMGDAIAIPINSANQTRTSLASNRWADTLNMIVIMSETEKRPPLTRAAFGLYINLHLPMASNFFKNQLEHQANRLTFSPDKWRCWVQNLLNIWENCNLQFSFNYTKYYTFAFFSCKPLIYNDFWRARLSVNPH